MPLEGIYGSRQSVFSGLYLPRPLALLPPARTSEFKSAYVHRQWYDRNGRLHPSLLPPTVDRRA
jgi:hypothetical protein